MVETERTTRTRALRLYGWVAGLLALATPVWGLLAIEPGREAEVAALFAPYHLGAEVVPGWRFMQLGIHHTYIQAGVEPAAGEAGVVASFRLEHPMRAPPDSEYTASFAVLRQGETDLAPEASAALDRLVQAVRANDDGRFWRGRPPLGGRAGPLVAGATGILFDGLILTAIGIVVLAVLVVAQLRRSPPWVGFALAAVVVIGAAVRWRMAEQVALGVWPYTRELRIAQLAFDGPILAWLTELIGTRLHYTDLTFALNFALAALTPLAIFAHGFYVLRDPLAALAAAALIAFLPNHIRFSRSEVEFIPSLVLTSMCFALLHAGLSAPSRRWRWAAIAVLPGSVFAAIVTRELNILMPPLLFLALLLFGAEAQRRGEVAMSFLGIAVAGVAGYVLHLMPNYAANVADGLRLETLANGVHAFFSPHYNTLLNPVITPPLVVGLAGIGTAVLWRRDEHRHAAFLVAWFAFYFVAHSYVLPEEPVMQARYHLHLAPPLVFLAAPAAAALFAWHRATRWLLLAAIALWPAAHADFIRDIAFNDQREFRFLRDVRDLIPDGCSVLEYAGGFAHDRRLVRIGTVLDAGRPTLRWRTEIAGLLDSSEPLSPVARRIIADPPPCLYWYEGLPCWYAKEPAQWIAPACAAVRAALVLEPVRSVSFASRAYDENLAAGISRDRQHLTLGLYRAAPVIQPAPR